MIRIPVAIWGIFVLVLAGYFFSPFCFGEESPELIAEGLIKKGEFQKAKELLEDALKKRPKDGGIWEKLGEVLENQGEKKRAFGAYKKALSFESGNQKIVDSMIRVFPSLTPPSKATDEPPVVNSPEEAMAYEIFKEAIKEKEKGNFETAFIKFFECFSKSRKFLSFVDENLIDFGFDFFNKRYSYGHLESLFYRSVYSDYKGDFKSAAEGFEKFAEEFPESPLVPRAKEILKEVRTKISIYSSDADSTNALSVGSMEEQIAKIGSNSHGTVASEAGRVINSMLVFLSSEYPEVRMKALNWFKAEKNSLEEVVDGVGKCIDSGVPQVSALALETLGELGTSSEKLLPEILACFSRDEPMIRNAAIAMLGRGKLDPSQVVPKLIELFENPDPELSNGAVKSLANYGEIALPFLEEVRDSQNPQVREKAAMTILLIKRND